MATCVNACTQASRQHVKIVGFRANPPVPLAGDFVTLSVDCQEISQLYGGTVYVDFVDIGGSLGGGCVFSQTFNWVNNGTTVTSIFSFTMPSSDVQIRVSASEWVVSPTPIPPPYMSCEDVATKIISLCLNPAGCGSGGGLGSCDPSNPCSLSDMCIIGKCIPKVAVGIGILAFVFMMISGGRK